MFKEKCKNRQHYVIKRSSLLKAKSIMIANLTFKSGDMETAAIME